MASNMRGAVIAAILAVFIASSPAVACDAGVQSLSDIAQSYIDKKIVDSITDTKVYGKDMAIKMVSIANKSPAPADSDMLFLIYRDGGATVDAYLFDSHQCKLALYETNDAYIKNLLLEVERQNI